MACGKLFLLKGKDVALVRQDKWACPLPPAPEGNQSRILLAHTHPFHLPELWSVGV